MDSPKLSRLAGSSYFRCGHTPLYVDADWVAGDGLRHDHDFFEIAIMTAGWGIHRCQRGDHPLIPGDVVVLRPGVWHQYVDCHALSLYNCCFGPELLQRDLTALAHDPALNYLFWEGPLSPNRHGIALLHIDDVAMAGCQTHLKALEKLLASENRVQTFLEQIGNFLLLLGLLSRDVGVERAAILGGGDFNRIHPAVVSGRALLESDCAYPWTLSELAHRLNIAPAYLVRLFHSSTGLAPMAYLLRLRAEQAAILLLRTDDPIGEIGAQVGWPDASHFARRFKACFGLSATEYRARLSQREGA